MGEKPPLEDKSVTHGMCPECYRRFGKGGQNDMMIFDENTIVGKVIYIVYWRRPEEKNWTRCEMLTTENGRDRKIAVLGKYGLICCHDSFTIPAPKEG